MTELEHEAMIGAEIIDVARSVARDVTGGNCAFVDSDIKLLGRLAALAIDAGLHNQLPDLSLYTRHNFTAAIKSNWSMSRETELLSSALDEIANARWPSFAGDDPVKRIQAFARDALALASVTLTEGGDAKQAPGASLSGAVPKADAR